MNLRLRARRLEACPKKGDGMTGRVLFTAAIFELVTAFETPVSRPHHFFFVRGVGYRFSRVRARARERVKRLPRPPGP